jgi:hypothetical protein
MPTPTPVEKELTDALKKKAESLKNGHKGDIVVMSEVLADLASVFVASIEKGGVTPDECSALRAQCPGAGKKNMSILALFVVTITSTSTVCMTVYAIARLAFAKGGG